MSGQKWISYGVLDAKVGKVRLAVVEPISHRDDVVTVGDPVNMCYISKEYVHETKESACAHAYEQRTRKLGNLRAQIKRLEKLKFE